MANVLFGPTSFEVELVVFDKDGTLIDFDVMWGTLARAWVEHLTVGERDAELADELCAFVGYDPLRGRTDGQGPLAIATTGQLQAIAAAVLYRRGAPWTEAMDRVVDAFSTQERLPLESLVHPAGDVVGVFSMLREAGVKVAVVTTDHRDETEETLHLLSCAHLVDAAVCGDDGIPPKPGPEMMLAVCDRLGVAPRHSAVVGDTAGDMLMASRSGAGLKVGVLTGAGTEQSLAGLTDILLPSIDGIRAAS